MRGWQVTVAHSFYSCERSKLLSRGMSQWRHSSNCSETNREISYPMFYAFYILFRKGGRYNMGLGPG